MNCNTCRFELSQCLDGRLPSGRRAAVMQHTSSCAVCATFWEELQAVQQLTLQLPREQVGESFRDQLWERIRAGEGTHEAIFREPVPLLVKARYALTGAAAAAAILLAGLWMSEDRNGTKPSTEDVAQHPPEISGPPMFDVNDRAPAPADEPDPFVFLNAARPLTADLVANEAARQIEDRIASLHLSFRQLSGRRDEVLEQRMLTQARDVRDFVEVIFELRDRNRVVFEDDVLADLRTTLRMLEQLQNPAQSFDAMQPWIAQAVKGSQRLGNLTRHIGLVGGATPDEENSILIHISSTRPQVFPKLFFVIGTGERIHGEFGMMPQQIFQLGDSCGASYVAPVSVVRQQRVRQRRAQQQRAR